MAAKCPNKSHEDWKYAVSKLGEDKTWYMYDKLGQEIPTKEQVDSIVPSVAAKIETVSPQQIIQAISTTKSIKEVEDLLLGYKGAINSKRWDGAMWVRQQNESTLDHLGIVNELATQINSIYPGLISVEWQKAATFRTGHGVHIVKVNEYAWDKYVNKDNQDKYYQQGVLFKRNIQKEHADLVANEYEEIKDFFAVASELTNAYEYIDLAESFFGNLSNEHKDLIKIMKDIRRLNPDIKIEQIYRRQLKGVISDPEVLDRSSRVLAYYLNNKVYIVRDNFRRESRSLLVGTVLHEIIHGFTLEVYNKWKNGETLTAKESQFIKETESLFNAAKKRTKYAHHNAYKNLGEFLADGITDQRIIDELKTMYDSVIGLTFWQKIKRFILKLFGLQYDQDSYHAQLLSSILDFVYKAPGVNTGVETVEGAKIADNIYINYDNPSHKAIVKTLSDAEEVYERFPEKFEGVTTIMRRLLLGGLPYEMLTEEKRNELEKYSLPGTETHFQIEKSFKSAVKNIEHKYTLTQQASQDLLRYFDKFKKPGVTILSEVYVIDPETNMVGVIDMVVIDENNKAHIFDFKTKIGGFDNFDRDYFPKKGEPYFLPFSSFKQAGVQLTAYANMFKNITNVDVSTMSVIPLKPTIDQENKVIEKYELDRSFNGKDIIDIPNAGLWMGILYSSKGVVTDKNEYQDVVNSSEQAQLIKTSEILWRKKLEELEQRTDEQEILLKVVKSLSHTIEITRKRYSKQEFQRQIQWLNKILAEPDTQKALSHAIDIAHNITKKAAAGLKTLKESGETITPAMLYKFKEAVSAFDILGDYESLLNMKHGLYNLKPIPKSKENEPSFKDFDTLRSRLALAIQYKNSVKDDYMRIGVNLMADFLYPFYTKTRGEYKKRFGEEYRRLKRQKLHGDGILKSEKDYDIMMSLVDGFNVNLTEKEYVDNKLITEKENIDKHSKIMIRKELKKAARDISTLEAWIDNVLDSPDAVTGALVKAFVIYDDTARIEIESERLKQLKVLREWEEYSKQYGKNYRKAYDDFIEKDLKTGVETGHLVSRFYSSLIKEYRNVLAITSNLLNEDAKEAYMKAWKEINMPLDKAGFQTAYLTYIDTLYADNIITDEERSNLIAQATLTKSSSRLRRLSYGEMVEKGKITENTEDLIIKWLQKNTWKYRTPGPQWENPQWKKLEGILSNPDDPRTKMYNMIVDAAQRADDMVPVGVKLGTRLPGIIKQKNERIASGQNIVDFVKGTLSKSLDFKVDDTHRVQTELLDPEGNAKYFVPTHFTGVVTKIIKDDKGEEREVFDPDEQSFDLANIYFNYLASTIDFHWKNNLLPEMELHKTLLKNRDVVQRDAFNNIKYRASRILGGEKGEPDEVTVKGGNIAKQFETWLLYALYGQAEKDLGVIPGTNIDAGKLLGNIQRYTALNLLGFNFVSGAANLILGETLQAIEAFAGKHIGTKEYHKAQMFYMKNIPGILGDIESRQPDNIVSLLLREFNVLHDPKIKNLTDKRFAAMMTSDAAFFTNHTGEHKMQTTFMLATLEKRRAYNKKGEDIGSMLDVYVQGEKEYLDDLTKQYGSKSGDYYEPSLHLPKDFDEVKSDWEGLKGSYGRRRYEHYVRGLLTRLHGEYSDLGRVALQQNAIGGMAYMFRKFIVPGFRRRWGALRYEERTEEFVEGNYRTTMRFAGNLIKSLRTQKALMLSREWDLMSDLEKANVIRTISEVIVLLTVIVLASVAIKFSDDDDEEGDRAWNHVAYQLLRLRSELMFFTSPKEAMKILRSPAASMSIIENTIKLTTQVFGPGWELYEQGPWKDHMKIEKTLIDLTIGVRQYFRLRDIEEVVDLWKI